MSESMPGLPPANLAFVANESTADQSRCMVSAVICTDAVDCAGDMVMPAGALLEMHRANPTVLYHHGIGIGGPDAAGHILPIGKAEDPAGVYTVRQTESLLTADTYFSQTDPFAMQVFALYAEKILRGWSVNALPVPNKWKRISDKTLPGGAVKRCYRYDLWALKEFSATALPVNPEALTVCVQRGTINGETMHPVLRAGLLPHCLTGVAWSNGVAPATVLPPSNPEPAPAKIGAHTDGDGSSVRKAEGHMADDKKTDEDRTDKKTEPDPGGKPTEADEKSGDDLKPGPRGMIDSLQTIRDHRMANAERHTATEDEDAMASHEAIDAHLAKAEEVATDYLHAKGHKDTPEPADFEKIKGLCKAAKPDESEMVVKGLSYRAPRFGVVKAQQADPPPSPADQKLILARLNVMQRRVERGKAGV